MPGPPGNVNAVRHGMRGKRHGLVHVKLGKRFAGPYADCCRLRREVEKQLAQQHGSVSLLQRARVQSLLRLEQGIRACELMIRDNPNMGPEEVRSNRSLIAQWTMQRDNVLAELLGANGQAGADPWAALDAATAREAREDSDVAHPAESLSGDTSGGDTADSEEDHEAGEHAA